MLKLNVAFASGLLLLAPLAGIADVILPVQSYSMFNGGTGSFDYRDFTYLPCPANNCDTTGAALSGGTGKLTDGVSPTVDWDVAGNPEPWVGWERDETNGLNPVVTFNFASVDTIHSVLVWFDNTLGGGGVGAPGQIVVNGTAYTPPQSTGGPQGFTISSLNITSNSVNIQFDQGSNTWIMIGEVTFSGVSGAGTVPEPSTFSMTLGATALAGLLIRRIRWHRG